MYQYLLPEPAQRLCPTRHDGALIGDACNGVCLAVASRTDAPTFPRKRLTRPATPNARNSVGRSHLILKFASAEYAVDDAAVHRWHQTQLESGAWPPMEWRSDGSGVNGEVMA